jgi:PAS domain S-box-containing protein
MQTFHFTKKWFVISVLCVLFIVMAAGWVFTDYLVGMATRIVERELENANAVISINLTSELKRIESAATAIAGSPLTLPLLQANTPENMEKVNNILDRYHKALSAAACYLKNRDGLTLTSSNRNEKDSFVGQNYAFRPYFQQAIKGGIGHLFAYGTVSKTRGFYASAPVRDKEGRIFGVVTIKKEIEDIETKLQQYRWFLVDQSGIIFMSSQPEARLKSLWPLSDEQQQKILLSKQYGPGPFEPVLQKRFKDKAEVTFQGGQYLASQHATPYEGISVVLLWPTGQISMYRSFGIILTLLALLLTLSFLAAIYTFTQSNFRMKTLLRETQSQATALAESEGQLRDRTVDLESQKAELLHARQAAEASRARSDTLFNASTSAHVIINGAAQIVDCNDTFLRLLGYASLEDVAGKHPSALAPALQPDGRDSMEKGVEMVGIAIERGRHVFDWICQNAKGEAIPVEVTIIPIMLDGEPHLMGIWHDLTERKRVEDLKVGKEVAEAAAARAEQARQEAERAREELKAKILEIERSHRLFLGREGQIIDLKRQVNALAAKAGEAPIYREQEPSAEPDKPEGQQALSAPEPEPAESEPQSLSEMLNADEFKHLLVAFCESVGIAAAIIDLRGEVLAAARWQRACTDFHRANEKTCARCIESDTELAVKLNEGKPFAFYRCKNGLNDAASPIIVGGKHVANTFIGQFFTNPPDMEFFRRQAEECGLDAEKYLEAIREVPVVAESRLEPILQFLTGMARTVATMSMERNLAKQSEISNKKRAEELQLERAAALSLAEDADRAKAEVEQYRANLELLVRQRTDELRASEERSNMILKSIGEGIFGLDSEGKITFSNPAASASLGYTEEEMLGELLHDRIHYAYPDGSEFPLLQCPMYQSSQDGQPRMVEDEVLWHKDGRAIPVEYTTTPVRKDGQVIGTVVSFRDIAERKQAEAVLKERMEELQRFSQLTIDREIRMIQLKEEVNLLLEQAGGEKKYKIVEDES